MSLSALFQQLALMDAPCEAAEAIADMARLAGSGNWQESCVKFVSAGVISPLVELLGTHSTAAVQQQAAWALRYLAVNGDNRVMIAAAGAIPPLSHYWVPRTQRRCRSRPLGL